MYEWNNGYQYIMQIRQDYIDRYGSLDIYNLKTMCERLKPKYDNFLGCVDIVNYGTWNLVKYSLIKGGDIDIYENHDSIYRELRALTVDMKTCDIVLCPFRKFFNVNEIDETQADVVVERIKNAKDVEIANKMDGSMIAARYYNEKVIMSGTGSLDTNKAPILCDAYTYVTDNITEMLKAYPDYTFCFEFISVKYPIVVIYKEEQQGLYLIGMRNVKTGEQMPYHIVAEVANKYNVAMTQIEERTFDEITNARKDYASKDKEGWVIFVDGILYKMKCEDYLAVHKIISKAASVNAIIHAIADDCFDDMIAYVPKAYHNRIMRVAKVVIDYNNMERKKIDDYYNQYKDIEDRKAFAQAVNAIPKQYRGYMFALKNGQEYSVLKSTNGRYVRWKEITGDDAASWIKELAKLVEKD